MVKVPKNIFPKPVSWLGLFFAASYNKTALSNFKKDLEISSNFGGLFKKKGTLPRHNLSDLSAPLFVSRQTGLVSKYYIDIVLTSDSSS